MRIWRKLFQPLETAHTKAVGGEHIQNVKKCARDERNGARSERSAGTGAPRLQSRGSGSRGRRKRSDEGTLRPTLAPLWRKDWKSGSRMRG